MDPNYISPFITSIQSVFGTMLQLPVEIGEPTIKKSGDPVHDVSGIIGMSGDVVGSVVLSMPEDTAVALVSLFTGEKIEPGSPDFADAIGELVNMVSGAAKALFPNTRQVSISCPSVVIGKGHTIARQSDVPCVLIPCTTDCGVLAVEIATRNGDAAAASGTAAQTTSA